jgi:hypothetical protein
MGSLPPNTCRNKTVNNLLAGVSDNNIYCRDCTVITAKPKEESCLILYTFFAFKEIARQKLTFAIICNKTQYKLRIKTRLKNCIGFEQRAREKINYSNSTSRNSSETFSLSNTVRSFLCFCFSKIYVINIWWQIFARLQLGLQKILYIASWIQRNRSLRM